jgi:hypothetical protein
MGTVSIKCRHFVITIDNYSKLSAGNGTQCAINYNAIVVFLVEEVKKLKQEITTLQATVTALQNK